MKKLNKEQLEQLYWSISGYRHEPYELTEEEIDLILELISEKLNEKT